MHVKAPPSCSPSRSPSSVALDGSPDSSSPTEHNHEGESDTPSRTRRRRNPPRRLRAHRSGLGAVGLAGASLPQSFLAIAGTAATPVALATGRSARARRQLRLGICLGRAAGQSRSVVVSPQARKAERQKDRRAGWQEFKAGRQAKRQEEQGRKDRPLRTGLAASPHPAFVLSAFHSFRPFLL